MTQQYKSEIPVQTQDLASQKNIPTLRFPEFSEEWEEKRIEDDFVFKNGLNKEKEFFGYGVPIINFTDVFHLNGLKKDVIKGLVSLSKKEIENYSAKKGDVFFTRTSETILDIGKASVLLDDIEECVFSGFVLRARPLNENLVNEFKKYCFRIKSIRKEIVTKSSFTTRALTSGTLLNRVIFHYPNNKYEQTKIANFLTSVDDKISALNKKKELLGQYKKGIMQQLFSQSIRFKDDDGSEFPEWEEKRLSDLLFEPKVRNFENKFDKNDVLSVSGKHGIVNQIEFQGRSFAGTFVDNYHVVETNDVVYTKSPLKTNPYGIIKTNKGKAGIVSTLYAVYRCKKNLFPFYIDYYFQLDDNVNRYLRPLVHKGAKNDMKINNSHVLNDKIYIGSINEQEKITSFLSSIDKKIETVNNQLKQSQSFKKGLLQQMFV